MAVNLASRHLGAGVIAASDEFFGEKENLLLPGLPQSQPGKFGNKGQIVDGWETRRRREPGYDVALVRLGAPGVIEDLVVDTRGFTGNYPAACSVQATAADGYPAAADLCGPSTEWVEIVGRADLRGDCENLFTVHDTRRFTHVRLCIYPDGGVARLRVRGEVIPDPRLLDGIPLDLAAQENGGTVAGVSDRFYSDPANLIAAGRARVMGEGWETRRRRDSGNDWVMLRLAAAGNIRQVVVDTSYFVGNAPAACQVRGCAAADADTGTAPWFDLLPRTPLRPDTRHRFPLPNDARMHNATHVRIDVYPDGGLARLRVYGDLTPGGRARLGLRWFDRLPAAQAAAMLTADCGLSTEAATALAAERPFEEPPRLEELLRNGEFFAREGDAAPRIRALVLGS
jgi:allantoicase